MPKTPGWWDYIREAFNARPLGMFVPPNWLGLAAFGLLGLNDPGFWVIGAGLELGYLSLLATNGRFQRLVDGKASVSSVQAGDRQIKRLLDTLPQTERKRFALLAQRCQSILDQQFQADTSAPGYAMQSESLGRLTWTYLRLLTTRQAVGRLLTEGSPMPGTPPPIPGSTGVGPVDQQLRRRLADLRRRLDDAGLTEELRRSLTAQAELLEQRIGRRDEANEKLAFLEAELTRIEDQVELIREQAVLSTDPEHLSQRIDEIGATLNTTSDWIVEQQRALGAMDDLLGDAPTLTAQTRSRESQ